MLVKPYGCQMKTESRNEVIHIWTALESNGHCLDKNAPMMPQESTNTT
ncbi:MULTISPECIES: hypothetical protein [Gammaproteobacteria]|nr:MULTISPECIES: hypothetical protein [Gammaproteobacteria]MBO9480260.1 hypothetical protein [Salinisphaera sp. G21_0]MBO9493507.1 hypothetical protein [Thalassotalea sp. G20_0]